MDGYSHAGSWKPLDRTPDTGARYQKLTNDGAVTLLLPSLNRRAVWQVQDSDLIAKEFGQCHFVPSEIFTTTEGGEKKHRHNWYRWL